MEARDLEAHSDHDILAALRAVEDSERRWSRCLHLTEQDHAWRALGLRSLDQLTAEARRRGLSDC